MLSRDSWLALDVYALVPGVRTLAEMCGVKLGARSTDEELQKLFGIWGTEKAFIDNAPDIAAALKLDGVIPDEQALNAIRRTGTLDSIPLRNIHGPGRPEGSLVVLLTGATANWMQRRVEEYDCRHMDDNLRAAALYLLAGERPCDKDSEVTNGYVIHYKQTRGRYPTEAELLPFIVEQIIGEERPVEHSALNQADQVKALLTALPSLAHANIYVPTNANATYVPLQIRRVIRELWPRFDADGNQFWFSQDGFPLATTPEEAADPGSYQRPLTVFSGLVRLLNELHKLNS